MKSGCSPIIFGNSPQSQSEPGAKRRFPLLAAGFHSDLKDGAA
jgi:hypothetical protein